MTFKLKSSAASKLRSMSFSRQNRNWSTDRWSKQRCRTLRKLLDCRTFIATPFENFSETTIVQSTSSKSKVPPDCCDSLLLIRASPIRPRKNKLVFAPSILPLNCSHHTNRMFTDWKHGCTTRHHPCEVRSYARIQNRKKTDPTGLCNSIPTTGCGG